MERIYLPSHLHPPNLVVSGDGQCSKLLFCHCSEHFLALYCYYSDVCGSTIVLLFNSAVFADTLRQFVEAYEFWLLKHHVGGCRKVRTSEV